MALNYERTSFVGGWKKFVRKEQRYVALPKIICSHKRQDFGE